MSASRGRSDPGGVGRAARSMPAGITMFLALVLLTACGTGRVVTRGATSVERIVVAADRPADYQAMWGELPTAGQFRSDQAALADLEAGIIRLRPLATATAADTFRETYEASTADVMTLVGHNDGGNLLFPDGSFVSLVELGDRSPSLAVISCESSTYADGSYAGLPSVVSLIAALDIERLFIEQVNSLDHSPSVSEMQQLLTDVFNQVVAEETQHRLIVTTGIIAGGGATAVVGVWVHEEYA